MRRASAVFWAWLLVLPGPARGQDAGVPDPPSDRATRRLFHGFVEDAAIVPGGFIEGQVRYLDRPTSTRHFAGPLVAFKVVKDVEAGLRFGYLKVDDALGPDGDGLSDIDLYLKYRLPGAGAARVALGALLKAPAADEGEGLGTGEPDLELFAALRADLEAVSLVAGAGVRSNGEPDGSMAEARHSLIGVLGLLLPATERVTFVIEAGYESERFRGDRVDARLTVGTQVFGDDGRGGFRAAAGLPLNDGAPDAVITLGAFLTW